MTPSSPEVRQVEHMLNLTQLIHAPSSSFTPDNTLQKQIWCNDELTDRTLQISLLHAQRNLEVAITRHLASLEEETQKLKRALQSSREQLEFMQAKGVESMKGDICVMVHQRWSSEKQTAEMVGGEDGAAGGGQGGRVFGQGGRVFGGPFLQLN